MTGRDNMALNWLRKAISGTKHALYIFLDEGGDFNFSSTGTRYFTISSVTEVRPFNVSRALDSLKYDLMEQGVSILNTSMLQRTNRRPVIEFSE